MFLRLFQHLLPRARSWQLTTGKLLRKYFEGLTGILDEFLALMSKIHFDRFPATTTLLDDWEREFALVNGNLLTEQQRRDRLERAWKPVDGQSPGRIQQVLQDNGFDVYVHEWWVPGTEPAVGVDTCATPRDPTAIPGLEMLVGKIVETINKKINAQLGNPTAQLGHPSATLGNYSGLEPQLKVYPVPAAADEWPYIFYIGDSAFGSFADVPANRKSEFEDLCLKISPTQQWIGLMINYV